MVKTQIQIPDALYRDLKRLAAAREWSLAETLRRAAEQLLARHPVVPPGSAEWQPPVSDAVGWRGLSHEAVHAAALDERVGPAPGESGRFAPPPSSHGDAQDDRGLRRELVDQTVLGNAVEQ